MAIPKIFHFVYFGFTKFTFIHYLAVATCYIVHRPEIIYLYVHHLPDDIECEEAKWFRLIKPFVTLEYVDLPTQIFGRPVKKFQHMADIIRLEKLLQRGGVYLDLDVISLKPFGKLYQEKCVMGIQCPRTKYEGLCNAVIMSERNGEFINRWYQEYITFQSSRWDHHSVKIPHLLSRLFSSLLKVVDSKHFFPISWEEPNFMINREFDARLYQSHVVHLWESEWEKTVLKAQDFSLLEKNSTFSNLVNPIIKKFNRIATPNYNDKSKTKINSLKQLDNQDSNVDVGNATSNPDTNSDTNSDTNTEITIKPDITSKPISWLEILRHLEEDRLKQREYLDQKQNQHEEKHLTIISMKKKVSKWNLVFNQKNNKHFNFGEYAERNINCYLAKLETSELVYHTTNSIILDFLKTCDSGLNLSFQYFTDPILQQRKYYLVADLMAFNYLSDRDDIMLDKNIRYTYYGNLTIKNTTRVAIFILSRASSQHWYYYLPPSLSIREITNSLIKNTFIGLDWKTIPYHITLNTLPEQVSISEFITFFNSNFSFFFIVIFVNNCGIFFELF